METISTINFIGTALFAIAILHTFSTKYFEHLAHTHKKFSGILHLLGEVEIVFGFWAMVLVVFMFILEGSSSAVGYVDSRNFTEPMFVFVIMVIAATKPILEFSEKIVILISKFIPIKTEVGMFFLLLSFVPLLGSFITEPAAMTLAALLLGRLYYHNKLSEKFKYLTLGVLFVNISIGGTLTPYAAPPVLMVAGTWNWDILFMMENFGWRSAIAVLINASALTFFYRNELTKINFNAQTKKRGACSSNNCAFTIFIGGSNFCSSPCCIYVAFLIFPWDYDRIQTLSI
jgi:hypothetical protein